MSRKDKLNALLIYQKAEKILKMVNGLLETIPEEDEFLKRNNNS